MESNIKPETWFFADGEKLRLARGNRRAADVAREVDISRQRLCDFEAGRKRVPGNVMARLCEIYGVNVLDLIPDGKKFAPNVPAYVDNVL